MKKIIRINSTGTVVSLTISFFLLIVTAAYAANHMTAGKNPCNPCGR